MSCLGLQLAFLVDDLQMQPDVLLRGLKEFRHQWLRQPGFLLETNINLDGAILGLINQKVRLSRSCPDSFLRFPAWLALGATMNFSHHR